MKASRKRAKAKPAANKPSRKKPSSKAAQLHARAARIRRKAAKLAHRMHTTKPPRRSRKLPSVMVPGRKAEAASAGARRIVGDGSAWRAAFGQQQEWLPSAIIIGHRHRKDFGDIDALAREIDEVGLLQPIVGTPDGRLIAGERRLKAWERSKHKGNCIPVHIVDLAKIARGEWSENAFRKDLTPSEAVAIKRELEPLFAAAAKERQRQHGGTAPGKKHSGQVAHSDAPGAAAPSAAAPKGRAVDQVAAISGMKRRSLEKAEKVVAAAEQDPGRFGKLKDDMDRTGRVDGPFRRLGVMQAADSIRAAPPPLPMQGPYRGGLIDPPWAAEPEEDDPERLARGYYPYPTMSVEQMVALDVPSICHADCVIGLWITNFHLALGHHLPILSAWGFRPVTIRTWVKDRIGRGQVLRGQTEHLIIARRGDPVIEVGNIITFFHAAVNAKAHSQKPAKAYDDFVRLVASERYFSLFETTDRGEKWDCHGDQVGSRPVPVIGASPAEDMDGRDKPGHDEQGAPSPQSDRERIAGEEIWVLEAAARGETFGTPELLARLSADKLIAGKKTKRITKAGQHRLHALREERDLQQVLAALPDDIGELVAEHRSALERWHAHIVEGDEMRAVWMETYLERIQIKANGGARRGVACDDSPAERLRRETAAPIGEVPMWGQRGMFRLDIDGTPYLAHVNENLSFEVYAAHPEKPFISETGFQALASYDLPAFGCTVDQQCEAYIREQIATPSDGGGKRKKSKAAMPLPEIVYRLPASWEEGDQPIEVDRKTLIEMAGVKELWRLLPPGHTVSHTIDQGTHERVATCQCGAFEHRGPFRPDPDLVLAREQDAAIEVHWRDVIRQAEGENSSTAEDPGAADRAHVHQVGEKEIPSAVVEDWGPMPDVLRRQVADGAA